MADSTTCSRCGAEVPRDAPGGHCLRCLLEFGLTPPPAGPAAVAPAVAATGDQPANFEQPGDQIGRYTLLQQVGEGGFGVVFLAEQHDPVHRRVGLKIIKRGMDTRAVVARFEAERQALALMDHPNIAHILDGGATDAGRPYFVMDFVPGVPITDYCDQHALSLPERLALFIQICSAVQHAHQKGVIHRDLKPSNILVSEEDDRPVPKVIDFGIAKATLGHRLTDKSLHTVVEQFAGTPAYMSPEQTGMFGLDVDARSDIYSLGILLYELLTSQPAFPLAQFQRAAVIEIFRVIREQDPRRPSTRLTTLSAEQLAAVAAQRQTDPARLRTLLRGDLDWIVTKALEKDRNRRYETPSGLAMDIQRHLSHEAVLARPPSKLYRLRKLIRRNRVAFAAGTTVFLALVIGLVVSLWFYSREKEARRRAFTAEDALRLEVRHSEQVAQFLKDMLEGVGPSVARGLNIELLREILDDTSRRLDGPPPVEADIELDLRRTLGFVYGDLGEFDRAEQAFRRALSLQRDLLPRKQENLSALLGSLANLLARQGKLQEAEAVARESLALRRTLFGNSHTNVALSLNALGTTLWFQHRLPEASVVYREALAIYRQQPAADAAGLADTLGNLGTVLALQGKPADAEALFREALTLQRQQLGPDHPTVAKSMSNLAKAIAQQGKSAEAEALLRETLALRRRILDPEHPDLAYTLHNLAAVLAGNGTKLAEAETLNRECLAIRRKRLLPGHALTAGTLQNLGEILIARSQPDEAARLLHEALASRRKLAGDQNSLAVADCLRSLALALRDQGKFAAAETALREALALSQELRPANDPATARLHTELNAVLTLQGKPTE